MQYSRAKRRETELCRFRFLKNHDSDSLTVFSNLNGTGTENEFVKELFSYSQFLISRTDHKNLSPDFEESTQL